MRKFLKILAWTAATIIGLLLLAFVLVKLFFPMEKAKEYAIEKGSAALGRPITVEAVDVSIWGGIGLVLQTVVVGSPEEFGLSPLFTADEVDIKLRLWPLLTGDVHVDCLIINRPQIRMTKSGTGTNNFTFAALDEQVPPDMQDKVTPEAKAAAAAISFDRLEVHDGMVVYVDASTQTRIDLENVNLTTSLENPSSGLFHSQGNLLIEKVQVVMDEPLPSYTIALKYAADFDVNTGRLSFDWADLSLNALEFRLKGELNTGGEAISGRMNIKSGSIGVEDLFKLLPPEQLATASDFDVEGAFALDVDIEFDGTAEEPLDYTGTVMLDNVRMARRDITGELKFRRAMIDFKTGNLRLNIEEGTFDGKPLKGHLVVDDFDDPFISGELTGQANLAFAQPFLPSEGQHKPIGEASFSIQFSGQASDYENLDFSGSLSLTDGSYSSALLPETIDDIALEVYFDNRSTRMKRFSGRMPSAEFSFEGRFTDLIPFFMADKGRAAVIAPTVDGTLKFSFDLNLLNQYLPEEDSSHVTGRAEIDLTFSATMTDLGTLKPRGVVKVENATFSNPLLPEPVERLDFEMYVSPDTVAVERMEIELVSSDLAVTGKLVNPFPYLLRFEGVDRSRGQVPYMTFELSSRRFDSDQLFPEAVPGSGSNRASVPVDSVPPIILPDIDGVGRFTIDTLIYSQVEFTNLHGRMNISERRIRCTDVTGKVYSGDVSGSTTIDLADFEKPVYTGDFAGKNIEANDFATRFSPVGVSLDGHLFGKINIDGSYSARGWEPEEFLNSLSMTSDTEMRDGRLITSGSAHSAMSTLAKQIGETFEKEQSLKNLKTTITVKDGKVFLDNLATKLGQIGDLSLAGSYAFTGELDYRGTLLLSPETTDKLLSRKDLVGGLAGLFSDKSSTRLSLPILVGGTADKPTVNLDLSEMAEDIGKNLSEEAGNLIKGLFKK